MELASGGRRGTPRAPVMIRGEARGASSRFGRGLRIEVVADGSVVVSDHAAITSRVGVAAAVMPFAERIWGPRWGGVAAIAGFLVLLGAWLKVGGLPGTLILAAVFVALLPLAFRMQSLIKAYCASARRPVFHRAGQN